jgi:hypothetical protein
MNGRRRDRLQQQSNWYWTWKWTVPVIQRTRMAAAPQIWVPCHEGVWRSGVTAPLVLNCSIGDECLVSRSYRFTVGGRAHWYSLDGRRGVAPNSWFVHCGERKTLMPGTEHRFIGRKSCRLLASIQIIRLQDTNCILWKLLARKTYPIISDVYIRKATELCNTGAHLF